MKVGDKVRVAFGITDPLKRFGETGEIVKITMIDDEQQMSVQFADGVVGLYFENCLIKYKMKAKVKKEVRKIINEELERIQSEKALEIESLQEMLREHLLRVVRSTTPLNDTQTSDKCHAPSKGFQRKISGTRPAGGLVQGTCTERQTAYQDPILEEVRQMCKRIDKGVRRLKSKEIERPRLLGRHSKFEEQCVYGQIQTLLFLVSGRLLPKMQALLNDNKIQRTY